jgi:hypothetical protein
MLHFRGNCQSKINAHLKNHTENMTSLYVKFLLLECKAGTRIPQSIQRWAMGWTAGIRFPKEEKDVYILHSVQSEFGAHPASYAMGT